MCGDEVAVLGGRAGVLRKAVVVADGGDLAMPEAAVSPLVGPGAYHGEVGLSQDDGPEDAVAVLGALVGQGDDAVAYGVEHSHDVLWGDEGGVDGERELQALHMVAGGRL